MNLLRVTPARRFRGALLCLTSLALCGVGLAQAKPAPAKAAPAAHKVYPEALVEAGALNFSQNCSFCHGRNADGGEGGPDLTQSKLVKDDVDGERISAVIRHGRTDKGMPPFDFSDSKISSLVAFIHTQQVASANKKGGRKGVEVADLQTGNADAGLAFFNGAGGCAKCHSATGDLAGLASRLEGLALEERMLYPGNGKATVKVTKGGQAFSGRLAYRDEFTVALTDSKGVYHSWRIADLEYYSLDEPANAHVDLLPKYTDADVHNLMAYLQTLK